MNELKLYTCEHCGNMIYMIEDSGITPECCGEPMQEVEVNTMDTVSEKHVPVISIDGSNIHVKVGSIPHPMLPAHRIERIVLVTDHGLYVRELEGSEAPEAVFVICGDENVLAAYAFCNLHGLWMAERRECGCVLVKDCSHKKEV